MARTMTGSISPPLSPFGRLLLTVSLLCGLGGCAGDDGQASATETTGATEGTGTGGSGETESSTGVDNASFFRYTVDSTINGTIDVDVPCSLPFIPITGKPTFFGEHEESGYQVALAWEEGVISEPGDYEITSANAHELKATLYRPHPTDEGTVRLSTIFDVTLSMQTVDGTLFEGSFDGWVIPTDQDEEGSTLTLRDASFRCNWF